MSESLSAQRFESLLPYMKSLGRLLTLSPSLLYPGHGPVVTDPVTRIQQYIEHRELRERQASREPDQLLREICFSLPSLGRIWWHMS